MGDCFAQPLAGSSGKQGAGVAAGSTALMAASAAQSQAAMVGEKDAQA
eukprot:gene2535-3331_t